MLYEVITAEKRDHRKLGKAMDLFHTQEEAPGMVFWHDQGWRIYLAIQAYIREMLRITSYNVCYTKLLRVKRRVEQVAEMLELIADLKKRASGLV